MIKKLKRIIATVTAAAIMAVCLSFAACGEKTEEDKYLNLSDEPVIFWEYYRHKYYDPQILGEYDLNINDIVNFNPFGMQCAWMYSKTPIDVANVEIKINSSYFYYFSFLEEVYSYETDCLDNDKLELFMEYNNADWDELLNLYNDDKNEYSKAIENWQTRYDAVKDNISYYVYRINIGDMSEEEYNDPTKLGFTNQDIYTNGALKLYAPETDEVTTLTTATFYIGGKVITHEFGEYTDIEKEDYNDGWLASTASGFSASVSAQSYSKNEGAGWNKEENGATGELFIGIEQHTGIAETREWCDVTLKSLTPLDSFITLEYTEVKYINALGVAVSEEWNGSELTFKARNQLAGDSSYYAFAVYFKINSSKVIPSYAGFIVGLKLGLSLDEIEYNEYIDMFLPSKIEYRCEYYAYMADDVNVFARENVWGYGKTGDWEWHDNIETYAKSRFWDNYLLTGHQ